MVEIDVEAVDSVEEEAGGADDSASETPEGSEREGHASDGVPVDAVDRDELAVDEPIDAPEYVLYGGKGGVGKTTMAAATAFASASAGTPTLVVSTDPAHSLSDTLEYDVPTEPTQVRADVPLYAAEIDPDAVMGGPFGEDGPFDEGGDEAGSGFDGGDAPFADAEGGGFAGGDGPGGGPMGGDGPMGGLGAMLGEDGPLGGDGPLGMGGPMPGADEAAAMQQLLRYLDDDRFERVVVDTAPTGHTLRLLELPEVMDSMVGRMMKMREKFSGMMEGIKGMFGGGADDPGAGVDDLEAMAARIERLRTVLRDPAKTDFRVVMIPEEMSVVESERLISRLDEFDIPVQTVVVNRVMEDLASVADVSSDWVVSPNLEDCSFCQRRWKVQQNALSKATDLFRGRDVKRVPLLADEVSGEEALRVVAACLSD